MKNLKTLFLFLLAVVITSCSNDNYSEAYVDTEVKTNLVAIIDASRTKAVANSLIEFTVTIPQIFDVASVVTVRATNTDSGSYKVSTVEVPAGSNMVTGMIAMPENSSKPNNFKGTSNSAFIEVTGVALSEGDDPYTLTSNKIYLTLLDSSGVYDFPYAYDYDNDGVIEPWLSINLDWEGPYNSNDLDLFVYDGTGTDLYEDSQSGSRFEGDFFNGNWNPDGVYLVKVDPYRMQGDSVKVLFSATDQNSKTTIVETTVNAGGGKQIIATITKSGGYTNDITYVIEPYN